MSRKLSWIALFLGVATFGTTLYLSLDWHWSCTPQGTVHVGTVFSCTVANWDFIQNISGVAAGSAMFTVGASAIEHKSGNKFASWLALFGVSIILIAVPSYFLLVAPTTINTGLRYYLVTSSGQQISTQFPFALSSLDPVPLYTLSMVAIFGGFLFGECFRRLQRNCPKRIGRHAPHEAIPIRNWSE
jgi:hypothetical protein